MPSLAWSQEAWTLQRCLEHAKASNIQLRQSMLSLESAELDRQQALAQMFPNLNGNTGLNLNFGRTIDPATNQFVTREVAANNFVLASGVTLFNGLRLLHTFKRSQIDAIAAAYDLQGLANDISMNVTSAFMQVMFNEEFVRVAQERLETTKQQLGRTQRLVDAGSLPLGNLLDVQAQMASDELQVVNAENALLASLIALQQMLNLRMDEPFRIQRPEVDLPITDISSLRVGDIYNTALANWPQVRAREERLRSAERTERIAWASYTPSLNANGSLSTVFSSAFKDYRLVGGELVEESIPYGTQLDRNFGQALGLTLSVPIFNGLQTRTAVKKSRLGTMNAELQLQDTKNQLFSSIQQAYNDATASNRQYEAGAKSVTAAERAFAYAEQRYQVGAMNELEFNTMKNNLAIARSELLRAKYDYIFRMKILDFYQGKPLGFNQ